VALHLLHRYCAVAAMLLLGLGALRAQAVDATRKAGRWLLALLLLELVLGSLTVVSGFSLWLAIGHSVGAAALFAAALQALGTGTGASR
jgi:cytochrome c oxidase assembly protein subunit 15